MAANHNTIKVNDVNVSDDAKLAIYAKNGSTNASARALKVDGKSEFLGGNVLLNGVSLEADTAGHDLPLGANSNEVHIGQADHPTKVLGNLQVTQPLVVGAGGANGIGNIEAQGTVQVPRPLQIGTGLVAATTSDVIIGRAGQIADVKSRLDAEAHIRVGTAANDGQVDAAASNRTLKLGTDANLTNAVEIANANTTTNIKSQVNINSKRLMLDAGGVYWIVYNANGHAVPPLHPSIDFAINGVVEFYIDDTGGHNL